MRVLFGHLNGPDTGTGTYVKDTLGMVEVSQMEVSASEEQGDVMFDIDTFELLLQKRRSAWRSGESGGTRCEGAGYLIVGQWV